MKTRSRLLIFVLFIFSLGTLLFFVLRQQKLRRSSTSNQTEQEVTLVSSEAVAPVNYHSQYTAERLIKG